MEIILGVLVSGFVQLIKTNNKTGEYTTLLLVALGSLAAAGIYTALSYAGYWETVMNILVLSGAFYTYVIKRFE